MKLFLFSASIFYILGLKLTSHIDILPHFFHSPVKIETKAAPETKIEIQGNALKSESAQKDSLNFHETKSGQSVAPQHKDTEKQNILR
ncbi:MAG: hypothetical protein WC384_16265 [Prolixibacteraceae bacterium]|jgi:hypothetical protein